MTHLLDRSNLRNAPESRPRERARSLALGVGLLALLFAVGCATGTGLTREQAIEQVETIGALEARLERAQERDLQVLAPKGVKAAQESLDQAIASAQGGDTNEAERYAKKGLVQLERAEADSQRTSDAMREVLARRQRAMAADAPTLLPERFETVETQLLEASRMAEAGDVEAAKNAGPRLLKSYSALELDALKTDATDLARTAIEEAREAGAKRYAPDTFARAQKELSIASGILETDRTRVAQANIHSRRASEFAARSQYISELVKEFDRMDYDSEAIVLWYQSQLEDLTSPLEGGISLTQPNHKAIADARNRIAAVLADQRQTALDLADTKSRLEVLELASTVSNAELEARLARLERDQREAEARYERVQGMFSEEEALVYRRGQDVLLETHGFDFPVGESEILSTNFGLLNKIGRAISEFDNPTVIVTGHTDATGNDATNQKLSDDRAKKVGDFLVQVGQLAPDRVQTEGVGEARPVASNETDQGRARNRRIEILIVNQPTGSGATASPAAVSAPPTTD